LLPTVCRALSVSADQQLCPVKAKKKQLQAATQTHEAQQSEAVRADKTV
jgi:hypothetical protein